MVVPPREEERRAAEIAAFRALLKISGRAESRRSRGGNFGFRGTQNEHARNLAYMLASLVLLLVVYYFLDASVSGEGALVTYFQTYYPP